MQASLPTFLQGPFGVNLVGYPRAEVGLGEDVRSVAIALETQGIPHCIVDVGLDWRVSQRDKSVEHKISPHPLYAINLFCQNGWETLKYLEGEGEGINENRYAIGLWPWELPEWPHQWGKAYKSVNEIWGISSYTSNSYSSFSGPVFRMGIPVSADDIQSMDRFDFGLPSEDYLFHSSFDVHSKVARKNPFGLISAFQKAFPPESDDKVGLVLKVHHSRPYQLDTWKLRLIALKDSRIRLIEGTLRRSEVLALMRCCDCYVSLHRAEGFGRSIAEALLLGRQLIVTGWSGNMDYCSEPRACLVRHNMISVKKGEYPMGDNQEWANPNLDHAAGLMRDIRKKPRDVTLGCPDFSPLSIGLAYAKRLGEIFDMFRS